MASKAINISIKTVADKSGIIEANKSLASLASTVRTANADIRQATLKQSAAFDDMAAKADRACKAVGGSYVDLEEQAKKLAAAHKQAEAEKVAAIRRTADEMRAAQAAQSNGAKNLNAEAEKEINSLEGVSTAMRAMNGNIVGAVAGVARLAAKFKVLGLSMASLSVYTIVVAAIVKIVSAWKSKIDELKESTRQLQLDMMTKRMEMLAKAQERINAEMSKGNRIMEEAAKKNAALIDASVRRQKAENSLARDKELTDAKDDAARNAINAKYDELDRNLDRNAADDKEARRIRDLTEARERYSDALRDNNTLFQMAREAKEDAEWDRAHEFDFDSEDYKNADERVKMAQEEIKRLIKEREKINDDDNAARNELDVIAAERAATEVERASEESRRIREAADREREESEKIAAAEAEAAKKAEAERLKAVEAERKAREKMEADLHRERVENAKAEVAVMQQAASGKQSVVVAAQTEFDRAFGMYRSEDHGAAQIAEERDYAADYKQLRKDASRYGGKWRIDELASLMAAGDTRGQAAKLEEWRKSKSFTPEVESMVRAAAADQTKTTAEDELRKIDENTKNLADKLDQLISMK